jgi:epoxyqueuosine reductase
VGSSRTLDPEQLRAWAHQVGFDDCGVAPVALPDHTSTLQAWLAAGYAGSMQWIERTADVRLDLSRRFEWARSVIVVLRAYRRPPGRALPGLTHYVASYAQGQDYHDVLPPRLEALAARLRAIAPSMRAQVYVDTGPVLERQLAVEAGLGWAANNTLLLHPVHGSRFFLGVLVTDLDLAPTPAHTGSCGTCHACQPACPTGAFVQPAVLDARRCISYLTIEHRGPIPRDLRRAMGQWLFGCDLCQTCCPFEIGASREGDTAFEVGEAISSIDLAGLLGLDEAEFRRRFRRTPLWRPRREGLLRNALIVAANGEHRSCIDPAHALLADASPVLREAASWCLARLDGAPSAAAITAALAVEVEGWVADAMREDLARIASGSRVDHGRIPRTGEPLASERAND